MFYALILSGKGKTDHSKNIPLAKNTHSDANSVWLRQNNVDWVIMSIAYRYNLRARHWSERHPRADELS